MASDLWKRDGVEAEAVARRARLLRREKDMVVMAKVRGRGEARVGWVFKKVEGRLYVRVCGEVSRREFVDLL